ncbi:rhoptry-associated 1, putative [Babesia ovata]|uniref:Rhoptry-associated 1, putative n=1 Tax=Babesia ovata TaxID=189622 RepID=A0A2H6KBL7_9APIC|nr:rhoptry-associated 1, putative [Babesia ovata]XP_028866636.1 rhoptry-associated 1, putative [Babesia ovata]GBE60387.1 rhoptry-associated 1, putative [Babesia ovata]GBE60393.1 rhoptry-associated 1, putative [Babesia ovata]
MAAGLKRIMRVLALYATLFVPLVFGVSNRTSRLSTDVSGGMPSESLGHEDAVANVSRARQRLNKAMSQSAAYFTAVVIDSVCKAHRNEMEACRSAAEPYMVRCEDGDCLHIDMESIEVSGSTGVPLPNKFQMDCAFELYKRSPAFPFRPLRGILARFQKGGRYTAYRDFILQLMLANVEEGASNDFEAFMKKYLFMAAVQYKTYLMLENWKVKLQNLTDLSHFVFVDKIERSLVQIIVQTAPKSAIGTPVSAIEPYVKNFAAYLNSFRANHQRFADLYSSVVFIALRSSISNTRHMELRAKDHKLEPWKNFYRKYVMPVFGAFKGVYGYVSGKLMNSFGASAKRRLEAEGAPSGSRALAIEHGIPLPIVRQLIVRLSSGTQSLRKVEANPSRLRIE